MNVLSKPDLQPGAIEPLRPITASDAAAPEMDTRRRNVKPLLGLVPFVTRYKGRAFAALVALTVAALATLAVPIAVRRMIDNGFDPSRAGLIDEYFWAMIMVVAVLAGASAARYLVLDGRTRGRRPARAVSPHTTCRPRSSIRRNPESSFRVSRPTPPRSSPRSARRCRSRCATSCCSSVPPP
jgi:hypothetical protein